LHRFSKSRTLSPFHLLNNSAIEIYVASNSEGGKMPKKANTPEQIINKLREAEILLSQGTTVALICKKIGVTDQSYYRWRKEYGGMRVDQARRLKELEQENARLKKVVADFALDNAILKEAARGNF
jgi:putative transposase